VILVDTSVWIDFFSGRNLPHVATLERFIQENDNLALCGIIMTEILQGIADDTSYRHLQRYLDPLIMLPMPQSAFIKAADIYRKLRKKGITIRKTNDCIIAATALEHRCQLLHNDKGFLAIGNHFPLKIIKM
jgi:predicted nucleic acid-binding protein